MPDANTLERRILLPRMTAAELSNLNPILKNGQMVLETDTQKYKAGDGVTPWNSLPYGRVSCVNGLDSDSTIDPLSAAQGKALEQKKRDRINAETNAFYQDGPQFVKYFELNAPAQNQTGNQLYFAWPASKPFYGKIKVTLATSYFFEMACGGLIKEYSFSKNENGRIFENLSRYTLIGKHCSENYSLADEIYVSEEMCAVVISRRDVTYRNTSFVKIEFFGYGVFNENDFYLYDDNWSDSGNLYKKPEYSLGNTGQFVYKSFGSPVNQEQLDTLINNIKDDNYIGKIAPAVGGLTIPGYNGLILGTSEPSGKYQSQIYMSYDTYTLKRRIKWNGFWNPWIKIIEMSDFQMTETGNSIYEKLPNGVILQSITWQKVTENTRTWVTFPSAFTKHLITVLVTPNGAGITTPYRASVSEESLNGIYVISEFPYVNIFAIGC